MTPPRSLADWTARVRDSFGTDAFEELIAIDDFGIAVGHHVRVFDEDHLNLLVHVELARPIHSNISYHIAASGGAHTPQREARPVLALYPMPAGAAESMFACSSPGLHGPSLAALDVRPRKDPSLGVDPVSTYPRIHVSTVLCPVCRPPVNVHTHHVCVDTWTTAKLPSSLQRGKGGCGQS